MIRAIVEHAADVHARAEAAVTLQGGSKEDVATAVATELHLPTYAAALRLASVVCVGVSLMLNFAWLHGWSFNGLFPAATVLTAAVILALPTVSGGLVAVVSVGLAVTASLLLDGLTRSPSLSASHVNESVYMAVSTSALPVFACVALYRLEGLLRQLLAQRVEFERERHIARREIHWLRRHLHLKRNARFDSSLASGPAQLAVEHLRRLAAEEPHLQRHILDVLALAVDGRGFTGSVSKAMHSMVGRGGGRQGKGARAARPVAVSSPSSPTHRTSAGSGVPGDARWGSARDSAGGRSSHGGGSAGPSTGRHGSNSSVPPGVSPDDGRMSYLGPAEASFRHVYQLAETKERQAGMPRRSSGRKPSRRKQHGGRSRRGSSAASTPLTGGAGRAAGPASRRASTASTAVEGAGLGGGHAGGSNILVELGIELDSATADWLVSVLAPWESTTGRASSVGSSPSQRTLARRQRRQERRAGGGAEGASGRGSAPSAQTQTPRTSFSKRGSAGTQTTIPPTEDSGTRRAGGVAVAGLPGHDTGSTGSSLLRPADAALAAGPDGPADARTARLEFAARAPFREVGPGGEVGVTRQPSPVGDGAAYGGGAGFQPGVAVSSDPAGSGGPRRVRRSSFDAAVGRHHQSRSSTSSAHTPPGGGGDFLSGAGTMGMSPARGPSLSAAGVALGRVKVSGGARRHSTSTAGAGASSRRTMSNASRGSEEKTPVGTLADSAVAEALQGGTGPGEAGAGAVTGQAARGRVDPGGFLPEPLPTLSVLRFGPRGSLEDESSAGTGIEGGPATARGSGKGSADTTGCRTSGAHTRAMGAAKPSFRVVVRRDRLSDAAEAGPAAGRPAAGGGPESGTEGADSQDGGRVPVYVFGAGKGHKGSSSSDASTPTHGGEAGATMTATDAALVAVSTAAASDAAGPSRADADGQPGDGDEEQDLTAATSEAEAAVAAALAGADDGASAASSESGTRRTGTGPAPVSAEAATAPGAAAHPISTKPTPVPRSRAGPSRTGPRAATTARPRVKPGVHASSAELASDEPAAPADPADAATGIAAAAHPKRGSAGIALRGSARSSGRMSAGGHAPESGQPPQRPSSGVSALGTERQRATIVRYLGTIGEPGFDADVLASHTEQQPLLFVAAHLLGKLRLTALTGIDGRRFQLFVRAVERSYDPLVPYHFSSHAADVVASCYRLLRGFQAPRPLEMTGIELLSLVVAGIIHDAGHPGVDNTYLIAHADPLAIDHNDNSPLENFHLSSSFHLMRIPALDFSAPLSADDWSALRRDVIDLVLGTDMSKSLGITNQFRVALELGRAGRDSMLESDGSDGSDAGSPYASSQVAGAVGDGDAASSSGGSSASEADPETRRLQALLPRQMLLKCADIGHVWKPTPLHMKWSYRVQEEFMRQGDRERASGITTVPPVRDRTKLSSMPKGQAFFLQIIARPIVELWCEYSRDPLPLTYLERNTRYWAQCVHDGVAPRQEDLDAVNPPATEALITPVGENGRALAGPGIAALHASRFLPPPPLRTVEAGLAMAATGLSASPTPPDTPDLVLPLHLGLSQTPFGASSMHSSAWGTPSSGGSAVWDAPPPIHRGRSDPADTASVSSPLAGGGAAAGSLPHARTGPAASLQHRTARPAGALSPGGAHHAPLGASAAPSAVQGSRAPRQAGGIIARPLDALPEDAAAAAAPSPSQGAPPMHPSSSDGSSVPATAASSTPAGVPAGRSFRFAGGGMRHPAAGGFLRGESFVSVSTRGGEGDDDAERFPGAYPQGQSDIGTEDVQGLGSFRTTDGSFRADGLGASDSDVTADAAGVGAAAGEGARPPLLASRSAGHERTSGPDATGHQDADGLPATKQAGAALVRPMSWAAGAEDETPRLAAPARFEFGGAGDVGVVRLGVGGQETSRIQGASLRRKQTWHQLRQMVDGSEAATAGAEP